jgi:hypothetical protein
MILPNPTEIPTDVHALLRAEARRRADRYEETLARARDIEHHVSDEETAANNQRVREATQDELTWLGKYTQTHNPHWKEEGRPSPYEPFPDKPYFAPLFAFLHSAGRVKPIEKSRDLMVTWAIVGFFTLEAMKVPGREIMFQTMKEEKVKENIFYAKTLYKRQPEWLKEAFPLAKPLERMSENELAFANGSVIWGIAGGAGQIRLYHPWGYFNDETAFQPEAGLCYEEGLSAFQKIVLNSTAWPGWYADWIGDVEVVS